ncbi:hypothetical protein SAMD00019534_069460, partial [Acytostelium subglobosum LB1]|uniref:hypothetical protein n=1 Tax=Acytostelium subglobosum LB1 TaxID=1410327 RepID=UPI000644F8C0
MSYYYVLLGFLSGIIFSTVSILYVMFRLLSKRVDPAKVQKKRQQQQQQKMQQQQQQQLQHSMGQKKKNSLLFASSAPTLEPLDFSIGKDTPPTSIETCKWINFITKRLLQEVNHSQRFTHSLYTFLNNLAEDESKPDFIGNLSFSDVNIGSTTPEIGTVKLISPVNASVNVFEFDLIYSGDASVTASSELWLNWPQKHMACLPVKTKISIKQFTGNFVLYIPNHTNPQCSVYLKESPTLTLRMVTKMGHETVLKEPGKLGQFLQNLIVKTLNQKLVTPNRIQFPLFSFLHPAVSNSTLYQSPNMSHQQQQQQQHQITGGGSSSPLMPLLSSSSPTLQSSQHKQQQQGKPIKRRTTTKQQQQQQQHQQQSLSSHSSLSSSPLTSPSLSSQPSTLSSPSTTLSSSNSISESLNSH